MFKNVTGNTISIRFFTPQLFGISGAHAKSPSSKKCTSIKSKPQVVKQATTFNYTFVGILQRDPLSANLKRTRSRSNGTCLSCKLTVSDCTRRIEFDRSQVLLQKHNPSSCCVLRNTCTVYKTFRYEEQRFQNYKRTHKVFASTPTVI